MKLNFTKKLMRKDYRVIGILDHMGHGNLGDAATQEAVLQNLRSRCPNVSLIGLSLNPTDTQRRHGIPSYAIRRDSKLPPDQPSYPSSNVTVTQRLLPRIKHIAAKWRYLYRTLSVAKAVIWNFPKALIEEIIFLIESFGIVRRMDLLVMSGGGQLNEEWYGPWSFPYTLFKWALLAKISGVPVIFLNVGAGTITRPLSRFFIRRALMIAEYCSFRDRRTSEVVKRLGFRGNGHVFPDNAYGLDLRSALNSNGKNRTQPTVGFAPMPYCDPRVYAIKDQEFYNYFVRQFAEFASWLIAKGYRLTLFGSDIHHDALAIEDIHKLLQEKLGAQAAEFTKRPQIFTTSDLFATIASVDYVVTCRYHGVIFSHLLNKPVLAVSHHPKVANLMSDLGLSDNCMDIAHLELDLLTTKFEQLVNNQQRVKASMVAKLSTFKMALDKQFDELFWIAG